MLGPCDGNDAECNVRRLPPPGDWLETGLGDAATTLPFATWLDEKEPGGDRMRFGTGFKVVLLAALTGGVVAVGAFFLIELMMPGEVSVGPGSAGVIVVAIDGAVATPGVVSLTSGARLVDAIDAAGGLLDTADTTGLNLAGRVGDGERITIPTASVSSGAATPTNGSTPPSTSAIDTAGMVNINTAGVPELDQLPGIGSVIAQRIIDFRDIHGPFESVDQLVEVEGISQAMVDRFRHMVTVGG